MLGLLSYQVTVLTHHSAFFCYYCLMLLIFSDPHTTNLCFCLNGAEARTLSFPSTRSHLVEAAVEYFFDFISFKGDGLEVSFVIAVEKRQGSSRICESRGGEGGRVTGSRGEKFGPPTCTLLPLFPVMILL